MDEEAKPKKRRISAFRQGLGVVALVFLGLVFSLFATGVIGNYEVVSDSMAPTLLTGDRVLVDQRNHYVPTPGDVVVFEDTRQSGEMLTKRVAAGAGQTIRIVHGFLYVDERKWAPLGKAVPVLDQYSDYMRPPLGRNEIYVLGDNVGNSEDSLSFGPVAASSIKGRLWLVYWPPGRFGRVR